MMRHADVLISSRQSMSASVAHRSTTYVSLSKQIDWNNSVLNFHSLICQEMETTKSPHTELLIALSSFSYATHQSLILLT